MRRLDFRFQGRDYSCTLIGISLLAHVVGIVGGVYGIGGGSIIAPFFVAIEWASIADQMRIGWASFRSAR